MLDVPTNGSEQPLAAIDGSRGQLSDRTKSVRHRPQGVQCPIRDFPSANGQKACLGGKRRFTDFTKDAIEQCFMVKEAIQG
jgi:hypothetical protein